MDSANLNTILFKGLISRLKASGYNVSVEHVLDVHALFLSFSLSEIKLEELKYLLAPLIAKSKEEQEEVYAITDDYIAEKTAYNDDGRNDMQPGYPTFTVDKRLLQREAPSILQTEPELKIILIVIALLALAAIVGLFYVLPARMNNANIPDITSVPVTDTIPKTIPADSSPVVTIIPPSPVNKTGFAIEGLHAFEPREKNINMQVSIILGLIAGVVVAFMVFRVKENEYFTDDGANKKAGHKTNDEATGLPKTGEESADEGEDISLPITVQFFNDRQIIEDDSHTIIIKKNLSKTGTGTLPVFNVAQSVINAVEKAGFYNPVYTYKKEHRKYLVLVDETHAASHLLKLFDYFIQNLVNAGIYIERYGYSNNIYTLTDERKNICSLREMAYAKPGFNLIIFGDGRQMLYPGAGTINESATNVFNAWQSRSLVTRVSLKDWGFNERLLQKYGFTLVPAETAGISLLAKSITGRQDISWKVLVKHLGNLYSVSQHTFTTAQGIEAYLGDKRLCQLVCAMAIHPRLNWSITLALYDALVKKQPLNSGEAMGDYNTLLKLVRMPIFNNTQLPAGLRLLLLQAIDKDTEVTARKVIYGMLQQARLSLPVNSPAFKALEEQKLLHEFFLYVYDRKEFKKYAPAKKKILPYWRNLRDTVTKDYVASGKAALMPTKADGQHLTIEEFMVKEREREIRKVGILRVLVTGVPALLIYLFLITVKPSFAYPKGSEIYGQNPVTVIVKKDSCSTGIKQLSFTGNNLDSSYKVNLTTASDTTILYNMDYDIPVTVEYTYKGDTKTGIISCRDSVFIVNLVNCK